MIDQEANKKRIVKNALALYVRTAIAMVVALVVTRILLRQLGEDYYGVYNVVAGVVVLFSFLNASITQAIQRFMTFALGKRDSNEVSCVFSTSIITQFIIIGVLVLLCETLGMWFVNSEMNIEPSMLPGGQMGVSTIHSDFCRQFHACFI